ncbi:hypothetical protein [Labrenzia sp. PHM005]|uniref:hypothetical protein n=1 Tax=Labrenzia sp. PHM005 TaxID=2590016 RepID=UPI00113FF0BA|nr:hypothetical protein [Labrenzia sp. PHM005]QDG75316.1 hypothetical protein FJ695_05235 [Labrenzia sp. PHM005]
MFDDLKARLAAWDGKNTQPLLDLYADTTHTDDWLASLVQLSSEPTCDRAATWLLKHSLESGLSLPADLTRQHLCNLAPLSHWEAKLHVLQYLDRLELTEAVKRLLYAFIKESMISDAKLIRAWGYYAFSILAKQFPEFKTEALAIFKRAEQTETAGSVKVRLRKAFEVLPI